MESYIARRIGIPSAPAACPGELPGNQRGTFPDAHSECSKVPRSRHPESGMFVASLPIQTPRDHTESPFAVNLRGTDGVPFDR